MLRFDIDALEPGDWLHGRGSSKFGKGIQGVLGSWGNHDGLFLLDDDAGFCVGEATMAGSKRSSLVDYEDAMRAGYKVRVWRHTGLRFDEREQVARFFADNLIGIPYPSKLTMSRLMVFRFVNSLPWEIKGLQGRWCTQLNFDSFRSLGYDPLPDPKGKTKKNPTPRTSENRLVAGLLRDVTHLVMYDDGK